MSDKLRFARYFKKSATFGTARPQHVGQGGSFRGPYAFVIALWCSVVPATWSAVDLIPLSDMTLDSEALVFASSATYGRAINGVSFQQEPHLTVGGYQFATWYHLGPSDEDVYLGRRSLGGESWEVMDTGVDMTRTTSDAHNVISMGVSGDGVIHLSWDHHGHTLKYMNSVPGAATGATWNASVFNGQQSSLDPGGASISGVTYPRFVTDPTTGDLFMTYRTGSSGNGDMNMAHYHADTGLWDTPHQIINGTSISVNPYLNGVDIDGDGRIHITWTWRPGASSTNYDIMYVYSDDAGATWRNGAGMSLGGVVYPSSSGIIIDDNDPNNGLLGEIGLSSTLMNQQTQAVDADGRVHVVMWHADDAHAGAVSGFNSSVSDYYHYYRDPTSGAWARTHLPNDRAVGSRPDLAYDAAGDIYVAYVAPGGGAYTDGNVVIASASRAADYADWVDVHTDTRTFVGEPFLDQVRLFSDGVVSVFVQENTSITSLTGTPLHILELSVGTLLAWAGDDLAVWQTGGGTDWDTDGDDVGDAAFTLGGNVVFDDGAATFALEVVGSVAPGATTFDNVLNPYTLSGAGIGGDGALRVRGGGSVTLAGGVSTYSGETIVGDGLLALSGAATLSGSAEIRVEAAGVFDVSAVSGGSYTIDSQTLTIDGGVVGNINAANGAAVHVNSTDSLDGDLVVQSGSLVDGAGRIAGNLDVDDGLVRVGGVGLSFAAASLVIDDFESYAAGDVRDEASPPWTAHAGTTLADIETEGGGNQVLTFGSDSYMGVSRDMPGPGRIDDSTISTLYFRFNSKTDDPDHSFGLADDVDTGGATFSNFEAQVRLVDDGGASGTFLLDARDGGAFSAPLASGLATETWYNVWMVVDQTTDAYDVYLNTGAQDADAGDKLNASPLNFRNGTTADLRYLLGLGGPAPLDNGVRYDDVTLLSGVNLRNPLSGLTSGLVGDSATLTVDADCTLAAGATLEVDVVSPAILDRVAVGGQFTAAGTLDVVRDPNAPTPQAGDAFDVIDAGSLSGAFAAINIAAPVAGDVWDLRNLYTTGVLAVVHAGDLLEASVSCLSGPDHALPGGCTLQDQDADGDVDLHDCAIMQACVTQATGVLEPGCLAE